MAETIVYYRNHQWMVTDFGIEAITSSYGVYEIEASRLTETTARENGTFYEWLIHMQDKGKCLDLNAFIAAFAGALAIHVGKYHPAMDCKILKKSILEATRQRAVAEQELDYD